MQPGRRLGLLALVAAVPLPAVGGTDSPGPAPSLQRSASADGWCQFRGPTGDGVSQATSVPVTWSTNHNVKWKVSLPGVGRSSPGLLGEQEPGGYADFDYFRISDEITEL